MKDDMHNTVLALTSLALGVIAIVSPQYRWNIISTLFAAIAIVLNIYTFSDVIWTKQAITELRKESDYRKALIDIKADISMLKMNKRGLSNLEFARLAAIAAGATLLYLVYLSLTN